ncbi:MAG TPA: 30S ribosomal protein S1 [Candidatus Saccharimonadales bacterium]|jgi:small subunit ribosomal protein S1|nr:30S ribosomal protein S1 [Candidatus Saccharimonadales bacterium]
MPNPNSPETEPENNQSFAEALSQHERSHSRKPEDGGKGLAATVVSVTADSVLLDIGYKIEGLLPLAEFQAKGETVAVGDKFTVSIKGRDPEGYYSLSRFQIARPKDWSSLEQAFAEKLTIVGTVTGVVKGGLTVDIGVRAFMPASRSGVREAGQMEKLVEQEIRCRIIKLDVTEEDVVVDRRVVAEEEERGIRERRYSEIKEGETMRGTVRSLADYGAFVDIGGVDGLLHVGDISWSRIDKPADVLSVGQEVETLVLKVDTEKRRISLGMKQLQPHPWDQASDKFKPGERVRGTVTRLMEFGAFVELGPGVEGLIHISEMSWSKKIRKTSDVVKPGETVEAVILGVNEGERRISLGLKQALGDPWADAARKYPVGSVVEGPVTSLQKFGAFVQLAEGVEGMIHIGDISAEKRLNHPMEALKMGQTVKAQVLEVDTGKRRLKLGIKQMVPSSLDEYIAEHQAGDVVSGRMVEVSGEYARVELGEGVQGTCRMLPEKAAAAEVRQNSQAGAAKADLSSLTSMLQARWKSGAASGSDSKAQDARIGQIRSFRIAKLDPEAKKIDLEPV